MQPLPAFNRSRTVFPEATEMNLTFTYNSLANVLPLLESRPCRRTYHGLPRELSSSAHTLEFLLARRGAAESNWTRCNASLPGSNSGGRSVRTAPRDSSSSKAKHERGAPKRRPSLVFGFSSYFMLSMSLSSTSLPGRVLLSGRVARGSSIRFSSVMKSGLPSFT